MKAYKGFSKELKCRDFQYEEGKEYETQKAECCKNGFHACINPLDCFHYYKPTQDVVYHEVDVDGDISKSNDDTKVAATKIKVGVRINLTGMIKAGLDFIFEKVKGSPCSTSGDWSTAATSGDWSTAATSGFRSTAATSGNGSTAATSGTESTAATHHKNNIAVANGKNSAAQGVKGSYIILTEWDDEAQNLIRAKMIRIDGKKYKTDTLYRLVNNKVTEVMKNDEQSE